MRTISIKKIGITDLETDAIVNAANEGLWAGGGVCGAIFHAAGHTKLQEACDKIGHCDTGSAVITPGFHLKAKYIIHAVGPRWQDGKHGEDKLLRGAYTKALELAVENGCHSIGFPLISAGIFGYPLERAWYEAVSACAKFLDEHPKAAIDIMFAVIDQKILDQGLYALRQSGASAYKIVEKNDWDAKEMPVQSETFILNRAFSPQQIEVLSHGHIPQEMEDKWFWYMEKNNLYLHRSWTGNCIYTIQFGALDKHMVTVNRDPEQYKCTDIEEDKEQLNHLLNWFTQPAYNYYGEWLAETAAALKKAGMIRDKLRISGQEHEAVFFHKPSEPNGYLSNWYASPFDLDGQHFTSAEQYIMYRKCMMFGDEASAKKVLATDDNQMQQNIGRKAAGYNAAVWSGARQMVAVRGLLAKFSQNEDLKKMLLETGDAYLVECAGSDQIWACGIRLDDERRFDADQWKGTNILGFALMEVREMLGSV